MFELDIPSMETSLLPAQTFYREIFEFDFARVLNKSKVVKSYVSRY